LQNDCVAGSRAIDRRLQIAVFVELNDGTFLLRVTIAQQTATAQHCADAAQRNRQQHDRE
jgi:hypothetical protein